MADGCSGAARALPPSPFCRWGSASAAPRPCSRWSTPSSCARCRCPTPASCRRRSRVMPGQDFGDLFSAPTFEHARDELAARGLGELFAATSVAGVQLQADGDVAPARGNVQLVSGEYFAALRQQPERGRLLTATDNRTVGAHPVAVVSDGFWRRRLNAAPDAVGRTLTINGAAFTIVGVTRPGFFGTTVALRAPDVWVPYMMQSVVRYSQNASSSDGSDPRQPWPPQPQMAWLNVFARVRGDDARHGRGRVHDDPAARAARRRCPRMRLPRIATRSAASASPSPTRPPAFRRCATPSRIRSTCCWRWSAYCSPSPAATSPGCCLSRATGRAREMAIRQSIGAGRGRLVRQMLAEVAAARGRRRDGRRDVRRVGARRAAGADGQRRQRGDAAAISTPGSTGASWRSQSPCPRVTGIACGVLPAIRGTRVSVADALKQDGRGSVTEGGRARAARRQGARRGADGVLPAAARRRCACSRAACDRSSRPTSVSIATTCSPRASTFAAPDTPRPSGRSCTGASATRLAAVPGVHSVSLVADRAARRIAAHQQLERGRLHAGAERAAADQRGRRSPIATSRRWAFGSSRGATSTPKIARQAAHATIVNADDGAGGSSPARSAVGRRWELR